MLHSAIFSFCFACAVYTQTVQACGTDEYECDNGRCTRQSYVCDMENNCGDWSDERNCNYSQSCVSRVRQCGIKYSQSYGSLPSSINLQQFVDALKAIPLETHCSRGGDFMQCMRALEEECSSETSWDARGFAVEQLIYNFGCLESFDDISNTRNCLVSLQTMQDISSCARSVSPPRGNCTEEAYAIAIDQMSSCIKQSFIDRIHNGADGCTPKASNLVTEFISEISGFIHPCPGSHGQKRAVRKIDHAMWKKKIQSYFNFKF